MKSYFVGVNSGGSISTSVSSYIFIHGTNNNNANATESNRSTVIPHALTLDRLRITCTTAPGVGTSYAYTVMKNGVATALTCTISGTNTSAQDLSDTVSFAAGDTISLQTTPTGTPTAPGFTRWSMRQDATGLQALISGTDTNASALATQYSGLQTAGAFGTVATDLQSVMPTGGVIKNLYAFSSAQPGAGKSYTLTLLVNGSATALTCAISDTNTTANDTTHSVSVSAGDTVAISCAPSSTPTAVSIRFAVSFQPTTDGESVALLGNTATPSTSATRWDLPVDGGQGWSSSETNVRFLAGATTFKAMYVLLTSSPGGPGTLSYTFTVRKNAADTTGVVAISGTNTTGNITGQNVSIADDDLIGIQAVPANTPATTQVKAGLLFFITPSAPAADRSNLPLLGVG